MSFSPETWQSISPILRNLKEYNFLLLRPTFSLSPRQALSGKRCQLMSLSLSIYKINVIPYRRYLSVLPGSQFRPNAPIFQLLQISAAVGVQLWPSAAVNCLPSVTLLPGRGCSLLLTNKGMQRHRVLISDWDHSEGPSQLQNYSWKQGDLSHNHVAGHLLSGQSCFPHCFASVNLRNALQ